MLALIDFVRFLLRLRLLGVVIVVVAVIVVGVAVGAVVAGVRRAFRRRRDGTSID